ncbi:ABC transporter permease [Dactylosporangium sp. NPDC000244]|uniref:ABC transporter permease n=1 Tax=Dactylosporangium sp. NPDC000244 TaxID=3154365 RepID=UPI00332D69DD
MSALRAEWTKLRTTPGPAWLLPAAAFVTAALGAAVSAVAPGPGTDPARLALSGVYLGQAPVAVLAVLAVSGEFSTALIRTTLTAIPNRAAVLSAKASAVAVAVFAAAGVAVLASLLIARVPLTEGPVLRAGVGTVAYLVLVALLSLGVAAAVRDSGGAIGVVLGLLYLPPLLTQMVPDPHLQRLLERGSPMSAGLAVQATTNLDRLPIGPWAGLGVLAAWSAASLLVGGILLRARDV